MSLRRPICCLVSLGFLPVLATAQDPVPRDPQAMVVLSQALAAMGATVPSDSVATGAITMVEGSRTETGTIRLLSRGVNQSAEFLTLPSGARAVIYSRGAASEQTGAVTNSLQFELVVTSQSPSFPLPLISAALANPDSALKYVGLETLGTAQAHHVRVWNTYGSQPALQPLATFTTRDVWIDAASGLPLRISYARRAARGAEPRIPVDVSFSNYRNLSGVLYPFHIEKSLNGTHWETITIQSVAFNTGLTDADFPVP